MPDENEKLEIVVTGDASSAEKMLETVLDLLNSFVSAANRSSKSWEKFASSLEGRTTSALQKTDEYIGKLNSGLVRTEALLSPIVGGINSLSSALNSAGKSADNLAASTNKAAAATNDAGAANSKTAETVQNLALQYKAGRISLDEYLSGLKRVAEAAESGSNSELAAIAKVREARANAARDVESESKKRIQGALGAARESYGTNQTTANTLGSAGAFVTQNVTQPIMAGGKDALKAAGDLEEAQTRVKSVFDDSSASVEAFADTAEEKLSISKRAALDLANSVGLSLTDLGMRQDEAADKTENLMKLAAGFGALKGKSAEDMMKVFNTGMMGKGGQVIKQIGVDMSESAIKAEALALGLVKVSVSDDKVRDAAYRVSSAKRSASEAEEKYGLESKQASDKQQLVVKAQEAYQKALTGTNIPLNKLEKAQAGYSILMKHAEEAAKGYAAAQNTEAQAHMHLDAAIENTAAAFGEALIPVLKDGQKLLTFVLHGVEALPAPLRDVVLVVLALAAAVGPALTGLSGLMSVMGLMRIRAAEAAAAQAELARRTAAAAAAEAEQAAAAATAAGTQAELTTAVEATTVAETEAAVTGASMFAAAAPWALAIIAATVLVVGLAKAWNDVRDAQIEAAQKNQDFTNQQTAIASRGPRNALAVHNQQVGIDRGNVKDQLDTVNALLAGKPTDQSGNPIGRDQYSKLEGNKALGLDGTDLMPVPVGGSNAAQAAAASGVNLSTLRKKLSSAQTQLQGQYDALNKEYADNAKKIAAMPADAKTSKPAATVVTTLQPPYVPPSGVAAKKSHDPTSYYSMVDIRPQHELMPSDLANAPTNASTYGPKIEALDQQFATKELAARQAGKAFDVFGMSVEKLTHAISISGEAIDASDAAMKKMAPTISTDEAAVTKAAKVRNDYAKTLNTQIKAGNKPSDDDKRTLSGLDRSLQATKDTLRDQQTEYRQNANVHRQATEAQIRDMNELGRIEEEQVSKQEERDLRRQAGLLKTGAITRDQYEQWLKIQKVGLDVQSDAYARVDAALEASVTRRQAALNETQRQILALDHKDFDAARQGVQDEAKQKRDDGVPENQVQSFVQKSNSKIDHDEWNKNFEDANEAMKASMDEGTTPLSQYHDFLVKSLADISAKFGQGSAEASKLAVAIKRVEWQSLSEEASRAKDALDAGTISTQQYIATLEQLRSQVASTSALYKTFSDDIRQENNKIIESAKRSADAVGGSFSGVFMKVIEDVRGARASIAGYLKDLGNQLLQRNVASVVSKVVYNSEKSSNPQLAAATAATQMRQPVATFVGGVNVMRDTVKQFVAGVNKMAAAQAGGGSGGDGGDDEDTGDDGSDDDGDSDDSGSGDDRSAGGIAKAGLAAAGALKGGSGTGQQVAGLVETAAKSGLLGKAATAAVPYLGIALAGYSLLSDLFGGSKKPDYTTHTSSSVGDALGRGDHSGLFDSGMSGSSSLRTLLSESNAKTSAAAASQSMVIHPGAIQIMTQPGQSNGDIAQSVLDAIGQHSAMQNALTPTGT